MQKIVIPVLFLFVICLSACKKDPVKILEERLLGKWIYVSVESTSEGKFTPNPAQHPYIEFKALGTIDNLYITEGTGEWDYDYNWSGTDELSFTTTLLDEGFTHKAIFSDNDKHLILYSEKTISGVNYFTKYTLTRPFIAP